MTSVTQIHVISEQKFIIEQLEHCIAG